MLTTKRILASLAICIALGGAVEASPRANAPTPSVGSTAVTPLPMQFFCASNPRECVAHRDATVRWTDDLAAKLQTVNQQVNAAIRPQANPRGGWKINPSAGDCNDYALTKRSRLIALGVPGGALRLAVTATRRGEKHLVLIVKTTSGDVVLDNLSRHVKTLGETGYRLHAVSGPNPKRWTRG